MRKELHKLVVEAIKAGHVLVSKKHALLRMEQCNLTLETIMDLAVRASIVEVEENFSYKRYIYPVCIIDSTTKSGAMVRSVWAYNKETKWVKLCSVYVRKQWFRYRVRG